MKISEVLEKVDEWQPNVFSVEDKLGWCYEVTRDILQMCPKFLSYKGTVTADGGVFALPEGVQFSDVSEVYVNGVRQERLDERTYLDQSFKQGDEVYVVYRCVPPRYELDENGSVPEALETVCDAPFDSMYIDYVCAQAAFQQNDADEYNKFIASYNVKFTAMMNVTGANAPVTVRKNFVNYY